MSYYKVNLGFAKYSDPELFEFAGNIGLCMTGNANFPAPPVSMADLGNVQTTFNDAMIAALPGGMILKSIKNDARKVLLSALRKEAAYVQAIAGEDLTMLLSSGFQANNKNNAQSQLDTPQILEIANGMSGQLIMRLKGVGNARSYEVQIMNGTGGWQPAGIFSKARGITFNGLTPGNIYSVQARAIGGSTGYSAWSMPASRMAM